MDWKTVASDVSKAAPLIGGLLGGPLGAAGGSLVTKMVSSALGVPDTADSVSAALAADPTAYEKLAEVESNNKVALQQLIVTAENNRLLAANAQYAAEAADRDSARQLAAKTPNDFMRPFLAISLTVMTAFIVWAVLSGFSETVIKDSVAALTVGTLIGYILSENKQVLGFYFGMTKDASTQNAAITNFAVAPGSVTAAPNPAPVVVNNAPSTQNVDASDNSNLYKGS